MAIVITAKARPASLFGTVPALEAMAQALAELAGGDTVTTAAVKRKGALTVRLCPTAYITLWQEKNSWLASADVETAGPGAHAAFYDLLDRIGERLSLKWTEEDPTGYGTDRSFDRMRAWHIALLRKNARIVDNVDNTVERPARFMNWPKNSSDHPVFGTGVITPMGWFENGSLAARAWQDAEALALDMYLWPNREKDSWYWRNRALWILWNHVCWTSEMTEEERTAAVDACSMLERAAAEDEWIPLPADEYAELSALLGRKAIFWRNPPMMTPIGIGYRRQDYRRILGGWSVLADGALLVRQPAKNRMILERGSHRISLETKEGPQQPFPSRGFQMTVDGVCYEGRVETEQNVSRLTGRCTAKGIPESLETVITWPSVYDDRWARMILLNIRRTL